jgi:hypothetical protein
LDRVCRSIAVDHLQTFFEGQDVAVACVFCNYKEQSTQTVSELLASVLKQIVQDQSVASDNMKTFYKKFRSRRPKLAELANALQSEIGTFTKVFFVVDALDECLETVQGDLIAKLGSLASTVYLMVTSRPLDLIQQRFPGASHLDVNADNGDVRKYIEGRILRERLLARLVETDRSLQDTIVDKVVVKVSGMYVVFLSFEL